MTAAPLIAEHGDRTGCDTNDAHHNMKAYDGNEGRVNRGHRNTEYNGCVARHADSASVCRVHVGGHRRLKQTRYGENAFEPFRNCARVDLTEDSRGCFYRHHARPLGVAIGPYAPNVYSIPELADPSDHMAHLTASSSRWQ
jgi:hypothetical protein